MSQSGASTMTEEDKAKDEEYKQRLTKLQYDVTRKHATERPFTDNYHDNKAEGMYKCICCGKDLFPSTTKYNSGTGWPSFTDGVGENLETSKDNKLVYTRTEVHCKSCKAHLGHVFTDGPKEATGLRYCINGAALDFKKKD